MTGPHQGQPRATAGPPIETATAAVLCVHGRGATAESILSLADEFDAPDVAYLAPQAANRTWYPHSFLRPIESNEPELSSALTVLREAITDANDAGIPTDRVALVGFSQGACLASEFVARNATRYGGLAALSGGLIGPDDTPREYDGSLDGTPVFVGCSDSDPHIPLERVHETTTVFEALGGDVTEDIYPGMGHGINADEVERVGKIVSGLVAGEGA